MSNPTIRLNAALEGRYRIESQLGEGGMATVYLAADLKHERKVALKVLRPELAAVVGAERFLAEIKTTANLQHPHILPLFDSSEADSFLFYVMPYVEGETLRERLDREQQLPVDDAVRIATNVAEALAYAHRQGVIHRDIKPANILLQDGKPVISDFGIALAVSAGGGGRLTETGLSLGTPHYMSPEQATGDTGTGAATDIYALGCVLYEMLTGEPPFTGSTPQAILGKIITGNAPSARSERDSVPVNVDAVIAKALEKIPADRFTNARDLGQALADPGFVHRKEGASVGARPWGPLSTVAISLAVVVGIVLAWEWLRPAQATENPQLIRAVVPLPSDQRLSLLGVDWGTHAVEISPDGSRVVYVGIEDGARDPQLYVRPLGSGMPVALPGTHRAHQPFFSPDGQWVGFFQDRKLFKTPLVQGTPVPITSEAAPEPTYGATWGPDGTILYWVDGTGLLRVPSGGGEPAVVPISATGDAVSARWPHFLPDGRSALIGMGDSVAALDLATNEVRMLMVGTEPRYLTSGHLMYRVAENLPEVRVVPFDAARLQVTGPPLSTTLFVHRTQGGEAPNFSVSDNGTLVYLAADMERELVLVDPNGRETVIEVEPRGYRKPAISPDGRLIAVNVMPRPNPIWVVDIDRVVARPVTINVDVDVGYAGPFWAPDGERMGFWNGWIRWRENDGRHRFGSPSGSTAYSWSNDDQIFGIVPRSAQAGNATSSHNDLAVHDLRDGSTTDFYGTPGQEATPMISPDGDWVAYRSDVSGRDEIYVLPFPGPGDPYPVTSGGGTEPRWSRDGAQLFYRIDDRIMVVSVRTSPSFETGAPEELFVANYDFTENLNWDVGPDRRFVFVRAGAETDRQFQLVVNWLEELKRLVPD